MRLVDKLIGLIRKIRFYVGIFLIVGLLPACWSDTIVNLDDFKTPPTVVALPETTREFGVIGALFDSQSHYVIESIYGGPAWRAGIRRRDILMSANGQPLTASNVVGMAGTWVHIAWFCVSDQQTHEADIQRVPPYMVDPTVKYWGDDQPHAKVR